MDRIEGVPPEDRWNQAVPNEYLIQQAAEANSMQPKQPDEAEVSMREQYRTGTLKYWRWE
jgi:hypothetical protein